MPRLTADLVLDAPRLRAERERVVRRVLRAARLSVADNTRGLEKALEAATRDAVPGRLWRAWRSEVYPRSGLAQQPTGVVFVNGGERSKGAMTFQTRAGRIKSKDGWFLAIPLPAAGSKGRRRDLTPGEWERRTGLRLRFVYRPNRPSLLVLDEAVLSGKRQIGRANTGRRREKGRGSTTVPIFVLLPQVAFANRFAVEPIVRRFGARLDDDFEAYLRQGEE